MSRRIGNWENMNENQDVDHDIAIEKMMTHQGVNTLVRKNKQKEVKALETMVFLDNIPR